MPVLLRTNIPSEALIFLIIQTHFNLLRSFFPPFCRIKGQILLSISYDATRFAYALGSASTPFVCHILGGYTARCQQSLACLAAYK